jgi:DNA-binding response OmpR family regulator
VEILMLTAGATGRTGQPLPALDLLDHAVRTGPGLDPDAYPDAVLVDARLHPLRARETCRRLRAADLRVPLIVVVTEAGLPAVTADWGLDDVVLASAGPAEMEARLRMAAGRMAADAADAPIDAGRLHIDPRAFSASVGGRRLDLTFKEFELLRFLALHPEHVFTRERLLREVWGFHYLGGYRTVDMHVRRLRAKLGGDEWMIATVRQVGYKLAGARRAGPRAA